MSSSLPPAPGPSETAGLSKVVLFGILDLAGIVAGWVVGSYVIATLFTTTTALNLPPNPTPAQVSTALGPIFANLSWILPITFGMELAAMAVLTLGYRNLSRADSRFTLPSTFMLVLMAGVFIVAAGVVPLFNSIPNVLATAPTDPNTTPSSDFVAAAGSLAIELLLLGLGGLIALIGFIGGLILGLWRVGSRYDETIIKVGAILLVVPLLNILAPILIIIGAYQSKDRLDKWAMPLASV